MRAAVAILLSVTASTVLCSIARAKDPEPGIALPADVKITAQANRKYFADAKGMTLYTFDRDAEANKSTCNGACANAWPPLLVSAEGAMPQGWSVVTREDGAKQWAFRGKPLYLFARDAKAGDTAGDGVNGVWQLAVVPPMVGPMPAGIRLEKTLLGQVFADANGKTLYFPSRNTLKCVGECTRRWAAVPAAGMARAIGDWSIVRRADGSRQWAYRDKPLYTFAGDFSPGQVNGNRDQPEWQVALQQPELRPKEIGLRETADGPLFMDKKGMTLYALERPGLAGSRRGNTQPGAAVCDTECLKEWRPLRPVAMTPPVGAWSVIKRADGSLQWAYDNKAVYTYSKDRQPGDTEGELVQLFVDSRAHSWRVLRPM